MPSVTRSGFGAPTWTLVQTNQTVTTIQQAFNIAQTNNLSNITLRANWATTQRQLSVTFRVRTADRQLTGAGVPAGATTHTRTIGWNDNFNFQSIQATGRPGYTFNRWWLEDASRPIESMADLRSVMANQATNNVVLVAGWIPVRNYTIRFHFNDGTQRFLYRTFSHQEIGNILTGVQLFYRQQGGAWVANDSILWRTGMRRIAWASHQWAPTNNPNATVAARNRLAPYTMTIQGLMASPYFVSYWSVDNLIIYTWAFWQRV